MGNMLLLDPFILMQGKNNELTLIDALRKMPEHQGSLPKKIT